MHPYTRAATSRFAGWIDWLHKRWPLLGLIALVLLAVAAVLFQEFLDNAVHFAWRAIKPAALAPVGVFGLLFILMLFALVVMGFVETSPAVTSFRNRLASRRKDASDRSERENSAQRIRQLESQVAAETGLKHQWFELLTFGYQLDRMPKLGPYDQPVMINLAMEIGDVLRGTVRDAEAVLGELRGSALMRAEKDDDLAWRLGERIDRGEGDRLSSVMNFLRTHLDTNMPVEGRDPRPYLVTAYKLYTDWRLQFPILAKAVGRKLEEIPGYSKWYESHQKFLEAFWVGARKPQLAALGPPAAFYDQESKPAKLSPPAS